MRSLYLILAVPLSIGLSACATQAADRPSICETLPEGDLCAYDAARDATADVETALDLSAENETLGLIVMGANWCHDSRALAGHFAEGRLATLIEEKYELVYVDVGQKNRNIDIAKSFGLANIVGTPTIIVTASDGSVLNLDTAPSWRNAASRSEADIYDYFEGFTKEE